MQTGTSPLLAAVYSQNLELVKQLIDHNAHVDTVSSVSSSLVSVMVVMIFFSNITYLPLYCIYCLAESIHTSSCGLFTKKFWNCSDFSRSWSKCELQS